MQCPICGTGLVSHVANLVKCARTCRYYVEWSPQGAKHDTELRLATTAEKTDKKIGDRFPIPDGVTFL